MITLKDSVRDIDRTYLANVEKLRLQLQQIHVAQQENSRLLQAIRLRVLDLHAVLQHRHRATEFLR